jgi:hypothetical protein
MKKQLHKLPIANGFSSSDDVDEEEIDEEEDDE